MKKLTLMAFVLTMSFAACKKEKVDPDAPDVRGTWKLVKYWGGFDGKLHVATDDRSVQFNNDHTFQTYKDQAVVTQGSYSIAKSNSNILNKEVYMVNLGTSSLMVEKPHADTLVLAPDVYDGGASIYVRKK